MKPTDKQICEAEVEILLRTLKRLVERIDFNGGIGEYKGGPAFVMKHAREAIEMVENKTVKGKEVVGENELWNLLSEIHGCKKNKENCNFKLCHNWGECKLLIEALDKYDIRRK